MKISVSNIAWTKEYDSEMYEFLKKEKVQGLEIAPTRIFQDNPYNLLTEASVFAKELMQKYNLIIPSMQSIWFGRTENIFSSQEERKVLLEYTKKAIDFASAVKCENLVFGCPRNRAFIEGTDIQTAIPFFEELGEYACKKKTVLSMEANPPIYNTNYCNTTLEAVELVKTVASEGFKINLDVGTMIQNEEDIRVVDAAREWINHIHISEPGLELVKQRSMHKELAEYLRETGYDRFISLEIKTQNNIELVKNAVNYLLELFA